MPFPSESISLDFSDTVFSVTGKFCLTRRSIALFPNRRERWLRDS
ncbi:hypothetical protein EXW54_09745 [Bacillus toyonensis]|nr:hypothetical protein EXW54_09745 [Bacillus toyonensis]